ncbi:MAG: ribosomal protein S18-alanine N-acetyltransferase [Terriglobales bacterium]
MGTLSRDAASWQIRTASAADVDSLLAIAKTCFGSSAWGASHFTPHPTRTIFVAGDHTQPCAGYSVLECLVDQAELQAIAVLPEIRRQGVGAALLRRSLAAAAEQGAAVVFLEVRETNLLAQRFYRQFGFEPCTTRPGYYRLPEEAAVVMRRTLSPPSNSP